MSVQVVAPPTLGSVVGSQLLHRAEISNVTVIGDEHDRPLLQLRLRDERFEDGHYVPKDRVRN